MADNDARTTTIVAFIFHGLGVLVSVSVCFYFLFSADLFVFEFCCYCVIATGTVWYHTYRLHTCQLCTYDVGTIYGTISNLLFRCGSRNLAAQEGGRKEGAQVKHLAAGANISNCSYRYRSIWIWTVRFIGFLHRS